MTYNPKMPEFKSKDFIITLVKLFTRVLKSGLLFSWVRHCGHRYLDFAVTIVTIYVQHGGNEEDKKKKKKKKVVQLFLLSAVSCDCNKTGGEKRDIHSDE